MYFQPAFGKFATVTPLLWVVMFSTALAYAVSPTSNPGQVNGPSTQPSLTVAILDFAADAPGMPNLGEQIGQVLAATLGGQPGYTLVDRASLTRVLQEHELNLTGLVDPEQATKIGKLVGAKLLISGKVFVVDKQIFMTAKLIGTETSLMDGILVKGEIANGIDAMIMQLSEKLIARLAVAGPHLVAQADTVVDPLPGLIKILAGKKLPTIAIRFTEHHLAEVQDVKIDPAVETELKMLFTKAGFTVIDGDDADLAKAGVQAIVTGQAFSEFAARIGTLVSCTDRVELKVIQRADGKVLLADRDNNKAVDLSDNLAGKIALQKSARVLGIRILQYFADNLPASGNH